MTRITFSSLLRRQKMTFAHALLLILLSEGAIHASQVVRGWLLDRAVGFELLQSPYPLLLYLAITLLIPLTFYFFSKVYYRFMSRGIAQIKERIFESLLRRPYPSFLQERRGEILSSYTNQVSVIQNQFFESLFGLLQILATSITGLLLLFFIHPLMVPISLLGALLAIFLPARLQNQVTRRENASIHAKKDNLHFFQEVVAGWKTIRQNRQEARFIRRFSASLLRVKEAQNSWFHLMAGSFQATGFLLQIYSVATTLFTAFLVQTDALSVGSYAAVLGILFTFADNLPYTAYYLQSFQTARENLKQINALLAREETGKSLPPNREDTPRNELTAVQSIQFDRVSFRYASDHPYLIENFSLHLPQPARVLLQGPSGSGKSTLTSLLFGYYPPESGRVTINGRPVQTYTNLAAHATVMRQEALFFEGTLRENLTMFAPCEEDRLYALLHQLGLEKFATKEALDRPIGNYSGGEARRMMIARALLRGGDILIFDEPVANLDEQTKKKIEAVIEKAESPFLFLISHLDLHVTTDHVVQLEAADENS